MIIKSLQNPTLKAAISLREGKVRRRTRTFLVEGAREIRRALDAGFVMETLLVREGTNYSAPGDANDPRVIQLDEKCFSRLAMRDTADGILAIFHEKRWALADVPKKKAPLYLAVEEVEKPGNLGALLRTADGAGFDGVFVLEKTLDIFHAHVIRNSLGTVFSLPVVNCSNADLKAFCAERNVQIFGAFLDGINDAYFHKDFGQGCVILLGSEAKGLSTFWQKNCDDSLFIPMSGSADSLNVAAAGAVLMYEARKQRLLSQQGRNS